MSVVVDADRHTHFAGSNHVDRCLIAFEDFKDLTQETCCQKHSTRLNLNGNDIVFCCNSLDLSAYQNIVDDGSFSIGFHRVLQSYRNTCVFCRLNTCRMQNLGTKISQLSSFLEVQLANGLSLFHYTRVVVVHAVNVSPNLNFLSVDGSTDKRSRIVATTTLQIIHLAIGIAADETLCQVDLVAFVLLHESIQFLLDILWIGFCILVRSHKIESRHQNSLDTVFLQIVDYHVCTQHFALSNDAFLLKAGKQVFGKSTQVVKLFFDEESGLFLIFVSREKFLNVSEIFFLQCVNDFVGSFRVLLVQIVGDFHQCVGRSAHGRKHHKRWFARFCYQ